MSMYNNEFYENRHKKTLYSAEKILSIVQKVIPEIKSAVDLGCGVGTWLSVLKERGASDIQGIDGNWVNKDYLVIPSQSFIEHDLSKEIELNKTYDLAISLEVAEHLPPHSAKGFVSQITKLSDFVLFSAAIPGQGGVGHVNAQWPSYWISLFEKQGFVALDFIRKRIWNDESIRFWYRQNIILFVKKQRTSDLKLSGQPVDAIPAELYLLSFGRVISPGIKQSIKALIGAVKRRIKHDLRIDS